MTLAVVEITPVPVPASIELVEVPLYHDAVVFKRIE